MGGQILGPLAIAGALACDPFRALAQTVADRHVRAQPTIYDPLDRTDYIMEAVGCGCAFLPH
jgi:hypothetical protein